MNYEDLKLEFFYLRKACFKYRSFSKYIYSKYVVCRGFTKLNKIFEKPINNSDLSMHIFACRRDFKMLMWSLESFYKAIGEVGELYIHNNSNLREKDKKILKKFFPSCHIVETGNFQMEYKDILKKHWLIQKFRAEKRWARFFTKLIDPYFVSPKKYRLIIDSDLLWLRKAVDIDKEINNGCQNSIMMRNNGVCPVYFKNNTRLDDKLASYNSGIVLYKKENLNLDKLGEYLQKLDENMPDNYHFIEQAGYAYCLTNLRGLSKGAYVIGDKAGENTVVRHYTSPRRPLFFIEGVGKLHKMSRVN